MAPSSVTSSMRAHETLSFISPSRFFPKNFNNTTSDVQSQHHQHQPEQSRPETPVNQQPHQIQMRDTAERYNRNNRILRHQASPVPAEDLATANLNAAFPAFSGVQKATGVPFFADPHNLESPLSHSKAAQSAQSKGKAKVSRGEREFTPLLRSACGSEDGASVVSDDGPAYYSDAGSGYSMDPWRTGLTNFSPCSSFHPSPFVVKVSNTRFGGINNPKTRQGPQPDTYKSAPGLLQTEAATASAKGSKPMAINDDGSLTSMPNGSTQSTLNLPQGPNLTAVFDGARRRPGGPEHRPGRDPPGDSRHNVTSKAAEAAKSTADELPVPARERHLLRTIDNLLAQNEEMSKELETTQITLEQKVRDHEAELKKVQERRDSGVDSAGSGNEKPKISSASSQRLERLATAYWDLTRQRDELTRRNGDLQVEVSVCQIAANACEKERSEEAAAVQATIKDLERQRDHLEEQLASAKSDDARRAAQKAIFDKLNKRTQEKLARAESDIEVLAQDKAVLLKENAELRAQVASLRQAPSANTDTTPDNSRLEHADADDEGPVDMDSGALMNEQPDAQQNKRGAEQQQSAHSNVPSCESSQNFTYISNAGVPKSDLVRNSIEHERKVRRQPQKAEASKSPVADMVSVCKTKESDVSNMHSRHSSDSSISTTIIKHQTGQRTTYFPNPQGGWAARRAAREAVNARRATGAVAAASLPPAVTTTTSLPPLEMAPFDPAAVPLAANLPPLELVPLTVVQAETQPSVVAQEEPQQAHEPAKLPIVPDEELDITIYNFEPPERPTQSPAAALTAVLESVQAERASQQVQLAKYQSNYNRQDINQRQRKQLCAKIIALTESIDCKADQIHNLHDLVVCQERKGQSMTQSQVDNTLQSLGLAAPWEGIASSTATSRRRSTASSS
ncbi:MAG: hypothetical protein Q9182_000144 [Xanthomendoza sp. 2 TL-2023]